MFRMEVPPFLPPRGIEQENRQASVFGVAISLTAFTFVVICLRLYVRVALISAVGADDVLMTIGTLCAFGHSAASMIAAYYGTGKHLEDIPVENFSPMLKAIYSTRLMYMVTTAFVKMSLLTFFLRLDHRTPIRWTIFSLMFFVVGLSVSSFFVSAFSCYPPAMFWEIENRIDEKCMSGKAQQTFFDANGILNILSDIFIYLIPIWMLWGVQISKRKKGALFAIFGLGILSIAASCVRYDYVRVVSHTDDLYLYFADSLNWCSIEIYVAIFCGSAPALSVLIKTYAPRVFSTTYGEPESRLNTPTPAQKQLQRLSGRPKDIWHSYKISGRRGLQDTELGGSEEAIVPDNGIVLKTELRMDWRKREECVSREGQKGG